MTCNYKVISIYICGPSGRLFDNIDITCIIRIITCTITKWDSKKRK